MDRIEKICSYLSPCAAFADIGCDHGYCTQYMLKNNMCKSAVVADISKSSLSKAENLLQTYINSGICRAVCCDGLQKISEDTDLVLIAGMGGEEIVKILRESFIPKTFLFQPMHNAADLRKFLLQNGCAINYDGIFFSGGKYYFLIKGSKNGAQPAYTPAQIAFGKDSIGTTELKDMLGTELEKIREYLSRGLSPESRQKLTEKLNFIQGVIDGDIT